MSNNEIGMYDVEDMSRSDLKNLGLTKLKSLLSEANEEHDDLNRQYHNGSSLEYPPDWYDQYVFPVYCIKTKLEDAISSINSNEEESEEDSY